MTDTQWNWWQNALAGERGELTRGEPKSGFYRTRDNKAAAIWRGEDGTIYADVKPAGSYCPRKPDEIDEAFGSWSMRPISHETYETFVHTGLWPDSIEPRGMGDNLAGMEPHERILAEITDLLERFQSWLKTLPNGIETDDQDAKAANYAKELASLAKKAEDTRTAEKKPFLEGGKRVDATWKPVVDAGDAAKKKVLAPTLDYRKRRAAEEERKRQEEIDRQRAEQERIRKEAAAQRAANPEAAPPSPPPPVMMPPKRATGLRTVKVCQITDLFALAEQIATMDQPPPEFVECCRVIARRMLEAGVAVNGAQIITEQRAA